MCLVLFAYNVHEEYPLILAANRDEFYCRPANPVDFWKNRPNILAGKDLQGGGTWLGITRQGNFATLTNYRDPSSFKTESLSRGNIVFDYLASKEETSSYLHKLTVENIFYNGFNLIAGNIDQLFYFSNITGKVKRISKGVHGLCNHLLNTPWPKVKKGKKRLSEIIASNTSIDLNALRELMHDKSPAPDEELPDTGVGLKLERLLSPIFISSPEYGTRTTTILTIDSKNTINFQEINYQEENDTGKSKEFCLTVEKL